tara:strand:+ start:202 stop:501 length:300 start_codon:yes stop_codon:yes gene_type:complete
MKAIEDAATIARAVRTASPIGVAAKLVDMGLDTQRDRRGDFSTGPIASLDRQVKQKKRKVSGYQKEFGRQMKKLKRAHPRTKPQNLMKRAHTATRKARR